MYCGKIQSQYGVIIEHKTDLWTATKVTTIDRDGQATASIYMLQESMGDANERGGPWTVFTSLYHPL